MHAVTVKRQDKMQGYINQKKKKKKDQPARSTKKVIIRMP